MRFLLCFLSLCFGVTAFAGPTKWPINSYKIIQKAPEENTFKIALTPAQIVIIEGYLVEVGEEYQRLGFGPPVIDTLTPDGKSFEVYAYDYQDSKGSTRIGGAQYGPFCASKDSFLGHVYWTYDKQPRVRFDTSRTLKNANALTDKMYEDLAHELFHAIQAGTPLFVDAEKTRHCKIGNWITEGQADAMGIYMGHNIAGIDLKSSTVSRKFTLVGARRYSYPLTKPKNAPDAYYTSSFWRSIGEYVANGPAFATDPEYASPADYRYLIDFLGQTISSEKRQDELSWLVEQLSNINTELKLSELYAVFVTAFAHYVPSRQDGDATALRKHVFDVPHTVNLSTATPEMSTPKIVFNGVSARQIVVEYAGQSPVDIGFRLDGTQEQIDAIQYIGMLRPHGVNTGTGLPATDKPPALTVLRANSTKKNSAGKPFSEWIFHNVEFSAPEGGTGPNQAIFIISSTPGDFSKTPMSTKASFRIALPTHNSKISWSK